MIRSLKKSGASEDVIKEFAEKFNKKRLDWLNAKSALKLTDNELRKLAGLGDNLFDCSDELLDVFKNSTRQDEIIDAIAKHGKDAADVMASYKDEAAELITKHGNDAVNAMKRGIDPALANKLDDLGIEPSKYDDLGIVGRESAEALAGAVSSIKIINHVDDIAKIKDLAHMDEAARGIANKLRNMINANEIVKTTGGKIKATVVTVVVDKASGKVYYGISGFANNSTRRADTFKFILDRMSEIGEPLMNYPLDNCGEFNAINNALFNGTNLGDICSYSVRIDTGEFWAPCLNCEALYEGFIRFIEGW